MIGSSNVHEHGWKEARRIGRKLGISVLAGAQEDAHLPLHLAYRLPLYGRISGDWHWIGNVVGDDETRLHRPSLGAVRQRILAAEAWPALAPAAPAPDPEMLCAELALRMKKAFVAGDMRAVDDMVMRHAGHLAPVDVTAAITVAEFQSRGDKPGDALATLAIGARAASDRADITALERLSKAIDRIGLPPSERLRRERGRIQGELVSLKERLNTDLQIGSVPPFDQLPPAHLRPLLELRASTFSADMEIITSGETRPFLCVVLRGHVRIHIGESRRTPDRVRLPGDLVGEQHALAFFRANPSVASEAPPRRTATVVAAAGSRILQIEWPDLLPLLEHPGFQNGLEKLARARFLDSYLVKAGWSKHLLPSERSRLVHHMQRVPSLPINTIVPTSGDPVDFIVASGGLRETSGSSDSPTRRYLEPGERWQHAPNRRLHTTERTVLVKLPCREVDAVLHEGAHSRTASPERGEAP